MNLPQIPLIFEMRNKGMVHLSIFFTIESEIKAVNDYIIIYHYIGTIYIVLGTIPAFHIIGIT